MARGGKRSGAGRKPSPLKGVRVSASFAARLLRDLDHEAQIKQLYAECGDARLRLHILFRLMEWEHGKPVQQVRLANPEGEKFQVEVDLVSPIDRLKAMLAR